MAFAALATAFVGYQVYSGERSHREQQKQVAMQQQANKDAKQQAKEAADRADVEMNKANQKRANVAAIRSKEEQSALSGPAGTLLTGTSGVDPNKLKLGGNTLLGA